MDYIEVKIEIGPFTEERADIVLAEVDQLGFESYQTEEPFLKCYIPHGKFSEHDLKTVLSAFLYEDYKVSYTLNFIREENWNAVWESDFKPITVEGECTIKAPYHHGLPKTRYTINIDPEMAFGSGHHETTCLMIKAMLEMRRRRGKPTAGTPCAATATHSAKPLRTIQGAHILDMGCGTGVLSILAAKMGAAIPVHAIDIDPIAAHSAEGNARRNRVAHKIKTLCGDASLIQAGQYDIVLANITRNILLMDLSTYARSLRPEGGTILLSGFFREDIPLLLKEAAKCGLTPTARKHSGKWALLRLEKLS